MEKIYIENVSNHDGKEVLLQGWLYNKRSSGKIQFLLVRDGTGIIQCVAVKSDVSDKVFQECSKLTLESSIEIRGKIRKDDRSPGGYEMTVQGINIIHIADEYPIGKKDHGIGFLMENRHLWIRSSRQHAILRIRAEVIKTCLEYLDDQGFIRMDSPILTPNACEGTTTLFSTPYFDQTAYLTQSGQLYAEATAMAFGKVYNYGPTFRAEKSKTRRHLTEFWMLEPEVAFANLDDIMNLAEQMITYVVNKVINSMNKELHTLERDPSRLEKIVPPFPRLSYTEAVELLNQKGKPFEWGNDFGAEEETILSQAFEKPLMIHRYPASIKSFYMQPDSEDERLSLCVDMLAPEGYGEIIGGSQRIHDLETLKKKLQEHDLQTDVFNWYLDLRKYGSVPHAGFGLGMERTIAWICGIQHIRETIPFPRTIYRLSP